MADCIEYLNIASVRAEFGADVADATDASIQRRIDQMVAYLEDQLGHTFGRALIARSTAADNVEVLADRLIIGGATYLFSAYATLYTLVAAVNAANAAYTLELLPRIQSATPSIYLKPLAATPCGPGYEQRVVLGVSATQLTLSGTRNTHLFLPLAPQTVVALYEDGVALTTTDYWLTPNDPWLVRKACACCTTCAHTRGRWSCAYPGNISLIYTPQLWGYVPGALTGLLLDAFSAKAGLAPFEAEQFGDYSYKRPAATPASWTDILGHPALRRYTVRFHP